MNRPVRATSAPRRAAPLRPPRLVESALQELVSEIDASGERARVLAGARATEERARNRRSVWRLAILAPVLAASFLFRQEAPRLLGTEAPGPAERRALLAAELERIVEEIEAYREQNGALVANLRAIDAYYGDEVRFEALSDRRYRIVLQRGGASVAYESPREDEP